MHCAGAAVWEGRAQRALSTRSVQKYCEHRRWSAANTQRFLEPAANRRRRQTIWPRADVPHRQNNTFISGTQVQRDRPPERRAARGAFSSGVGQGSVNSGGLHRQALSRGTDISPPALQAAGRFLLLPAFPSLPARRAAHLYKGRYRLEARFARILKQKLIFPHQRLYAEAA